MNLLLAAVVTTLVLSFFTWVADEVICPKKGEGFLFHFRLMLLLAGPFFGWLLSPHFHWQWLPMVLVGATLFVPRLTAKIAAA